MIVNCADILEGFKRRWDEGPYLRVLVPGGVHEQRAGIQRLEGEIKHPYATLAVVEGQREDNSSLVYTHPFTLTLTVCSKDGIKDAGRTIREIDQTFDRANTARLFIPGADKTIDLKPMPGDLTLDAARHEGADQVLCKRVWELVIQATR